MNYYENGENCQLMIWETNPRLRNTNKKVNFVSNEESHNVGDFIIVSFDAQTATFGLYTIEQIEFTKTFNDVVGSRFRNGFYHKTLCSYGRISASNILNHLSLKSKKISRTRYRKTK